MSGHAPRIHSYRTDWVVPELRSVLGDCSYHDDSVLQVHKDGTCSPSLHTGSRVTDSSISFQAHETTWRQDVASLNYVETSTWTRQEHNGFSHQNPAFISAVLELKPAFARVYLPPDANCFLSTVSHCLRAKNYINLMVGSKQPTTVWLSPEEADRVSGHNCIGSACRANFFF